MFAGGIASATRWALFERHFRRDYRRWYQLAAIAQSLIGAACGRTCVRRVLTCSAPSLSEQSAHVRHLAMPDTAAGAAL
ncbi:MAG: hypothetical protein GX358_10895 [candidate division WS1 bacterium]|nr:hypothetical protein [candidate division WS1 bacterium]